MSLGHGRHYLSIPGPSVMPDRVLQAMHQAAPNIYEGALYETVEGMLPDLRRVARTQGEVAFYICNGHAVHHQQSRMTSGLDQGSKSRDVIAHRTSRIGLRHEDCPITMLRICCQLGFDLIQINGRRLAEVQQIYFHSQLLSHIGPECDKATGIQGKDPISPAEGIGQSCFPNAMAITNVESHLSLGSSWTPGELM